jgi:prepilin-type N-terminal cleavage/methylation domain-containing protein
MEMSLYRAVTASSIRRAKGRASKAGFSILEVVVAIAVLAIGLSAMAALVAQSLSGTARAHFMALATTLASEKLEDLNRYPNSTPPVAQLTTGGSLSSDATVGTLNYYDDVDLSSTNGEVSETVATSTGYSSVDHYATGVVVPNNNAAAPSGSGNTGFHRRWLIEASPVVNGVTLTGARRITVLVTLSNQSVSPPVTFQMSTVRP